MSPRLPDADARMRAATDFDANLVVEAGAGAGKTSLLVERTLVAVGSGVAPMRRIAAITFTERAAGEMRERVATGLGRLIERCDGAAGDRDGEADRAYDTLLRTLGAAASDVRSRALEALEELDGAAISTIHAFCSSLLREFPFEAGVDPDFVVDEGQLQASAVAESWEAFLAEELGPDAARPAIWDGLLARLEIAEIGEAAAALVAATLHHGELPRDVALDAAGRRRLAGGTAERLAALRDDPTASSLGGKLGESLCSAALGFERFVADGPAAGREALERFLQRSGCPSTTAKKLPATYRETFNQTMKHAWRLARTLVAADDEVAARLVTAVEPFVERCRETLLRSGIVTFDALLGLARRLVAEHPVVRRRLKGRFRLVLVDEFQDTDPLQYEIVLFLAEEDGSDASRAYDARLAPGRLFVVGDPKQSIYRFRGADYAAYRRAVERIVACGGARLELSANFRSVPGVLEPVNALFTAPGSIWRAGAAQPGYVSIAAARAPHSDGVPRVEVLSVRAAAGTLAAERRLDEGRAMAAAILRLREEGVPFGSVTVLLRAFTDLSLFLRGLREAGVPFAVDGGRDFVRRPEVGQMVAVLRALAQPADEPALLAYLRCPAGAVPDAELAAWAAGGGRWSWRETPDADTYPRVAAAFSRLRELDAEIRDLPADVAVRRVLTATRLVPLGAAAWEGAQRVANLRKLAAAAAELARDGGLTLEQVTEALAEGRLADIETDSPLADDRADAVRLTSIHRMKGLENDVVLVGDLFRGDGGDRGRGVVARVVDDGGDLPRLALSTPTVCSSAWLAHTIDEREHGVAEETRVLYVALTRARERLILMSRADPARGVSDWVEALSAWGYDPRALPADGALGDGSVLHRAVEARARRLPRVESPPTLPESRARWQRVVERLAAEARPAFARPSASGEPEENRAQRTPGGGTRIGRAVGIAVHRALERFAPDDPAAFDRRIDAACRDAAVETDTDEAAVRRDVGALLRDALASSVGERLRGAEVLGREVPVLLGADDGTRYRGSIDLLYRGDDGRVAVADYKTDSEPDDRALVARYGPQLAIYARAVQAALALPAPPAAELWLLRRPCIIRL